MTQSNIMRGFALTRYFLKLNASQGLIFFIEGLQSIVTNLLLTNRKLMITETPWIGTIETHRTRTSLSIKRDTASPVQFKILLISISGWNGMEC